MPIHIKWVRNHIDQVQEWQRLRRQNKNDNDDEDNVDDDNIDTKANIDVVLETQKVDKECQRLLYEIRQLRQSINQLSNKMRQCYIHPNNNNEEKNNNDDDNNRAISNQNLSKGMDERTILLERRKQQQSSLKDLEQEYIKVQVLLNHWLLQIASPVDLQIQKDFSFILASLHSDVDSKKNTRASFERPLDFKRNSSRQLVHAIQAVTMEHFCPTYPQYYPISSSVMAETSFDDLAAMWGLENQSLILENDSQREREKTDNNKLLQIEPWVSFVAQILPTKLRFGTKELPQFTLLQGNNDIHFNFNNDSGNRINSSHTTASLQLLAVTAGTLWDARQVQLKLVEDLCHFYSEILGFPSSHLHVRTLPPHQLHPHEQSRLVIVYQTTNLSASSGSFKTRTDPPISTLLDETTILGSVSNWGDAAARARDLVFQGGGKHDVKDYVNLVVATIVRDISQLAATIVNANTTIPSMNQSKKSSTSSKQKKKAKNVSQEVVNVPLSLHRLGLEDKVPLQEFLPCSPQSQIWLAPIQKQKQKQQASQSMNRRRFQLLLPQNDYTFTTSEKPIHSVTVAPKMKTDRRSVEAIACPFGFLLS